MNNNRIIKNIGISMAMRPISVLLSLVYTPLALSFLGENKYGIWVIILNIVAWINYFDIGIGNGLRNKLAEAIALEDNESAQKYVSTAYIGASLISATFFMLIVLIWNVGDLTNFFNLCATDENTNVVFFISVFFVSVNFIFSLSKTSAYAIQEPGIISIVDVIGQVFQITILFVVSKLCTQVRSLFIMSMMCGAVSLFDSVLIYWIITKKRPYLKPKLSKVRKEYVKPLLILGMGFFILQICSLVFNTTDNLLISSLYGSAEVTPYSIAYKVFHIFVQIHAIIIMPMWSAYTEAAVRRDLLWLRKTIKRVNIITVLLALCILIGIFVFEPLVDIWLQKKLVYGKPLIIIVAVYMIVQMIGNNYSSFLCGVGYIKMPTIVAVIGAVVNIPLSIFFAQNCNLKLAGIILGSLAATISGIIVLPLMSYKWLKDRAIEWGKYPNA